jgi:hypothetical protein
MMNNIEKENIILKIHKNSLDKPGSTAVLWY